MIDSLPLWFWLPASIIAWALVLFPVFLKLFGEDDPNPDEQTPLDVLEHTGIYPR